MTFNIPDSALDLHEEGVETMIQKFGTVCTLHYPPTKSSCPNCYQDPGTQRSSGRYKSGGPVVFTNGSVCPYCGGAGYLETEVTEDILMRLYFDTRPWLKLISDLNLGETALVAYGYAYDIDRIRKSVYLTIPNIGDRFGVNGYPAIYGFRKKYAYSMWKQTQ